MSSLPKLKEVREKICKDFFPNCNFCTCFCTCFPDNIASDVLSRALDEHENIQSTVNNGLNDKPLAP